MPSRSSRAVLSFEQLQDGYNESVENSVRFFASAAILTAEYPDKALALAQLGQEEVGRSLTLLAAFNLRPEPDAWTWVWKGWSDHQLKAHRAYLYEMISPLRVELAKPDGGRYAGEPLRSRISQEKESGLYVDFDEQRARFLSPARDVPPFEAAARTSTLAYLCGTADATRRALMYSDSEFRLRSFSEIALRICSEDLYQQDMPALLEEFRKRSSQHEDCISDLEEALAATAEFFRSAVRTGKEDG